jgi:hypothetical protein
MLHFSASIQLPFLSSLTAAPLQLSTLCELTSAKMYRMAAAFDELLLIITFVRPCQQLFFAEIMRMRHFIFLNYISC